MSEELDREEGIKAIIDLQAVGGITETREAAEVGWDSMSLNDRKTTMEAHKVVCHE